jgi:hypothetical protein
MAGEEDRKHPPHFLQSEAMGDEDFATAGSQAAQQAEGTAISVENRGNTTNSDRTTTHDAMLRPSDGSGQFVDPTPSGPSEPTRNIEIELPANWNKDQAAPSSPSEEASRPAAGPTEPSHHIQIELPADWDGSDGKPTEPSGSADFSPSAPAFRWPGPNPPNSSRSGQGDRERLVPSILVTVSLGHSRDMFEQAVEAAIQRATQKFHKIAKQEIDLFAFEQRAARRAADYRLRGPNPQ